MERSRKTNITGNQLENTVKGILKNKGFKVEMYRKWKENKKSYGDELLLKNVPLTTIYHHPGNTEFLLLSKRYKLKIRIECKWQQAKGSVDEKLPYLYLNAIEAMPEDHILILIDGDGWKDGAKAWLREAVATKKYTTDQSAKKNIKVFSIVEFLTWANNSFQDRCTGG